MIAVDTSVWIDFLRDLSTPQVEVLVQEIVADRIVVPDLVLAEVLQGCNTDREFADVLGALRPHRVLQTVNEHIAIAAAHHYRSLRAPGITVRKTIDTLVVTRCITDDIALLYSDGDFDPFVRHLGLRSALDEAGVN